MFWGGFEEKHIPFSSHCPKYTEKRRENKHASHNFTGNPHDPVAAAWNAYEQRLTCVPISMRKEGDPQ